LLLLLLPPLLLAPGRSASRCQPAEASGKASSVAWPRASRAERWASRAEAAIGVSESEVGGGGGGGRRRRRLLLLLALSGMAESERGVSEG